MRMNFEEIKKTRTMNMTLFFLMTLTIQQKKRF